MKSPGGSRGSEEPVDTTPITGDAGGTTDVDTTDLGGAADSVDEEALSIDDILGNEVVDAGAGEGSDDSQPPTLDPGAEDLDPDKRKWPGEFTHDEPSPLPAHSDTQSNAPDASPSEDKPEWETESATKFVDTTERTDAVDVSSAVADKNLDKDERLRNLGWDKYGDKLRNRGKRRRKKDGK